MSLVFLYEYYIFPKLADHRWIEEEGYIKMHHILSSTRATPGTPSEDTAYSIHTYIIKIILHTVYLRLLLQIDLHSHELC